MRVAAVDFGKARIGLAVSDDLGLLAHPRPTLSASNVRVAIRELSRIADEEGIDRFLVGLPLELRGAEGPAAARAREFAQQLADVSGREVELIDERLSTKQATRRLREGDDLGSGRRAHARMRARVDGAAAAVLLQGWLDGRNGQLRPADA